MSRKYALSYSPIMENASGDLAVCDVTVFKDAEGGIVVFPPCEGAVAAWVREMGNQSFDLVELCRRRGFGLIYSACPQDGSESMLFNVEVHGFGAAMTD